MIGINNTFNIIKEKERKSTTIEKSSYLKKLGKTAKVQESQQDKWVP